MHYLLCNCAAFKYLLNIRKKKPVTDFHTLMSETVNTSIWTIPRLKAFEMTVKANYLPISGANYKRHSCTATKTANSETTSPPISYMKCMYLTTVVRQTLFVGRPALHCQRVALYRRLGGARRGKVINYRT